MKGIFHALQHRHRKKKIYIYILYIQVVKNPQDLNTAVIKVRLLQSGCLSPYKKCCSEPKTGRGLVPLWMWDLERDAPELQQEGSQC